MITANGMEALSLQLLIPWSGPWSASCVIGDGTLPAAGNVVVQAGAQTLVGSVDPERSATFGERRTLGVIAGAGGWRRSVRAQDFHSDVGVALQSVVSATAAEVGESVIVLEPARLGEHVAREQGPAALVLRGRSWWVGLDGVTRVGPRPALVAPSSLIVSEWDPEAQIATVVCDELVEPGTVIVDELIGGSAVVTECDLEMKVGSVRGTVRLRPEPPAAPMHLQLGAELAQLARAAVGPTWLASHEYRVVAMQGDRALLQAVHARDGVPDLLPVALWFGVPGVSASLAPGASAMVGFTAGDATRPRVELYDGEPQDLELAALGQVRLGGAGGLPVLRMTPALAAWIAAVSAAVNTVAPGTATPPSDIASGKVMAQ